MKKYIISGAAALTLTCGTLSGYHINKRFDELENKKKELTEQVSNLADLLDKQNKLINNKDKRLFELSDKIQSQTVEIHNLKRSQQRKDQSINSLKLQLEQAKKRNESPRKQLTGSTKSKNNNDEIYEVTAYHAGFESTGKNSGNTGYGVTASGTTVKEGRTIACPPELPFGTKVHIDTVGDRVCEDRGGAIKGKIIDLYIADRNKVWEFGRRKLKVTILG